MITKKEVQHIAALARLGITITELERFQKDLSLTLEYVEKLKEVDIAGVKPTSHPLEIENVTRDDDVKKEEDKLITGFLKVKSILK